MRVKPPGGAPDVAAWLDDDAGPVVRSFVLTGGRTDTEDGLDLMTHVVTTGRNPSAAVMPEERRILARAMRPTSVAEIAAHLDRPLGVVRVLLTDLHRAGAITIDRTTPAGERPDDHVLGAVIDGLRSL
jgi:hypothetical protein